MILHIELGAGFQQTLARMSLLGRNISSACRAGLNSAVQIGASNVSENYMSGQASGLTTRTGNLRRAVQGWLESDTAGIIGVREGSAVEKYKYLLGGDTYTIKPISGRLLSIPMDYAKTPSGVLKSEYSGGLRSIAGGFFKEIGGRLFFCIQRTERSKLRILFRMVPQVTVTGRDVLAKGVIEAKDKMTDAIQNEITKVLNN